MTWQKTARITVASLFFIGITLLFLGVGRAVFGWMAHIQFVPACLALNVAAVAAVLVMTLLFGRIYCSAICPLGIFQDAVIRLRHRRKFRYVKGHGLIRYAILALVISAIIAGVQVVVSMLDPYSIFGRSVRAASAPETSAVLTITGLGILVAIAVIAFFSGRGYCNTICPVGTFLGLLSRFSVFKPRIDTSKCTGCRSCERHCKSGCIDVASGKIDYSRCVDCFDCVGVCKAGAIRYSHAQKSAPVHLAASNAAPVPRAASGRNNTPGRACAADGIDRRKFLAIMGLAAVGAAEARAASHGVPTRRGELIVPPGAVGVEHFYSKCTACQLCVSSCPEGILQPSVDAAHFLQPQVLFKSGSCRKGCTVCSDVCPSGAIGKFASSAEKDRTSIGTARVIPENCVGCGKCVMICPNDAIVMRYDPDKPKRERRPVVNPDKCTGCGTCEHGCPVKTSKAIVVDGLRIHKTLENI